MFRILIDMRYRSFIKFYIFQWAEGFYAETLMGLFGEQGAAGGEDPAPLVTAQLHPEEVP